MKLSLGEWAWNRFISGWEHRGTNKFTYYHFPYLQIAIKFLGKKEINKRLREIDGLGYKE